MRNFFLFLLIFSVTLKSYSQESFLNESDTLSAKRVKIVTSLITTNWIAQTTLAYQIWYKDFPKSSFHLFNDSKEWLQMDKVGHFYTANKLSALYSNCYIWTGMKPKKAVILGSILGLASLSTLEILDGFNNEWGFSLSDMAANTLGSLSYASQKLIWNEERFILKFSAHPTQYATLRPNVLGSRPAERFFKDYNGQTYWVSFSPFAFSNTSKLPKWLCLSLGYSVDQKIVGNQNSYVDSKTNLFYSAKREMLLSLDIDFSKLPIKKRWLKVIISQFNYLKIPFPTLIFSNGKMIGKGVYF
jgi:hypothetical protein